MCDRCACGSGHQLVRTLRKVAAKASGSPMPPHSPPRNPSWPPGKGTGSDRKSTRLNSSHSQIPYAVFCFKKKNTGLYTDKHIGANTWLSPCSGYMPTTCRPLLPPVGSSPVTNERREPSTNITLTLTYSL